MAAAMTGSGNPAMSNMEKTMAQTFKSEANEALWLIFAATSTKHAQELLCAALQRNLAPDDEALRARIAMFMGTKMGEVLVAGMLSGLASGFSGMLAERIGVSPERFDKAASRYRVHALASGGQAMVDEFLGPLMEGVTELVRGMPDDPPAPRLLPDAQPRETVSEKVHQPDSVSNGNKS